MEIYPKTLHQKIYKLNKHLPSVKVDLNCSFGPGP